MIGWLELLHWPFSEERSSLNHANVNMLLTQVEGLPCFWLIQTFFHLPCHNPSFGLMTKAKGLQGLPCFWLIQTFLHLPCHNPSFGLMTKAKGLQGYEARGSPGITSHTPRSVRKCKGVNPHTPKATPTLRDEISMDFQNFREQF
jgi:hypothetical protein